MSLPVREFRAKGFRSLETIAYPMSALDVFVSANGVGKTNLYRALELLKSAANKTLARDLADDGGGFQSAFWAGPRTRDDPVRLHLSVGLADPSQRQSGSAIYRYEVEVGFRPGRLRESAARLTPSRVRLTAPIA